MYPSSVGWAAPMNASRREPGHETSSPVPRAPGGSCRANRPATTAISRRHSGQFLRRDDMGSVCPVGRGCRHPTRPVAARPVDELHSTKLDETRWHSMRVSTPEMQFKRDFQIRPPHPKNCDARKQAAAGRPRPAGSTRDQDVKPRRTAHSQDRNRTDRPHRSPRPRPTPMPTHQEPTIFLSKAVHPCSASPSRAIRRGGPHGPPLDGRDVITAPADPWMHSAPAWSRNPAKDPYVPQKAFLHFFAARPPAIQTTIGISTAATISSPPLSTAAHTFGLAEGMGG